MKVVPPNYEWIKIPHIFQKEDLPLLHKAIDEKIRYHKTDWGLWLRARDHAVISIMYECALRPLECLSLRFDDIDQNLVIRIRPESNKEKTGRIVPLPESAMPYLKKYLSFPRERFWQGSPWMFPSFECKQSHVTSGRWKARFRDILKGAGFWKPPINSTVPPFRSYTLRMSKATHILEKTHDLRAVQLLLGHKKLESTVIYTKLTRSYQEWLRGVMSNT